MNNFTVIKKNRSPLIFRAIVTFLVLLVASAVLISYFNFEFGKISYWNVHGVFLLFFLALFPRLTLLFSSIASGGLVWWLAWIFAPRILIAILATQAYFQTNPVLVVIAWLVALSGEATEKVVIRTSSSPGGFAGRRMKDVKSDVVM